MPGFIKQTFTVLVFCYYVLVDNYPQNVGYLNNEPCTARPNAYWSES